MWKTTTTKKSTQTIFLKIDQIVIHNQQLTPKIMIIYPITMNTIQF